MELKRKPFQGVLNILDFNRHFYYYGLATLVFIVIGLYLIQVLPIISSLIIFGFAYGLLMPLIVSAYVYDFSGYYEFDWLDNYVNDYSEKLNIVNINAGFDETSYIISEKFENAEICVFDFYNEDHHTEPAIVRARKVSLIYPNTQQIDSDKFPIHDNAADIVFLLSTAHEIRLFDEKVEFLKECKRVCKSNGKVIMVEHLRDVPNFLAFTIGFTHFFSKKNWLKAFRAAGFSKIEEAKFTPFMSIFECKI